MKKFVRIFHFYLSKLDGTLFSTSPRLIGVNPSFVLKRLNPITHVSCTNTKSFSGIGTFDKFQRDRKI